MSLQLLQLATDFAVVRIAASDFADRFMERWKFERDNGIGNADPDNLSECLSTIFCLADLFNPENDRDEYELDATQLRCKVEETLREHDLIEGDIPTEPA